MAKVVYLLGAGASRGRRFSDKENFTIDPTISKNDIIEGLPVVTEIPERLQYVIDILENTTIEDDKNKVICYSPAIDVISGLQDIIKGLKWLKDESQAHATIDTFAKKLYLKKQFEDFDKVKKLLAIYFTFEQIINKTDSRYDTFLANVLDEQISIPSEICIVTWNYDSFLELAFKEYVDEVKYPCDVGCCSINDGNIDYSKVHTFKVNGVASFDKWFSIAKVTSQSSTIIKDEILIDLIFSYYKEKSLLCFAWENDIQESNSPFLSALKSRIKEAKTLVVIGYTFPFFNRQTDRWLIKNMPGLETIYIQDPQADKLLQNIYSVIPPIKRETSGKFLISVIPINNTDQFYLPPEL